MGIFRPAHSVTDEQSEGWAYYVNLFLGVQIPTLISAHGTMLLDTENLEDASMI